MGAESPGAGALFSIRRSADASSLIAVAARVISGEAESVIRHARAMERRRLHVVERWLEGATAQAIATELGEPSRDVIKGDLIWLRQRGVQLPLREPHRRSR